jgi:hypothetical protein
MVLPNSKIKPKVNNTKNTIIMDLNNRGNKLTRFYELILLSLSLKCLSKLFFRDNIVVCEVELAFVKLKFFI